jgi:hypothetical protein
MKKHHRSALGKSIDMDNIRLQNEEAIAVGNMRVNARGDELGPGGVVVRSRNQLMDEYYRLNTPTPVDTTKIVEDNITSVAKSEETVVSAEPMSPAQAAKLKGNLASTFAKK